jgi:outer membrane lipoprotein carrier protein
MKTINRFFLILFLSGLVISARSQTPAEHLKALLQPIKTFQADFTQTTTSDTNEPIARASGILKIVRPGQFYWQVNQPGKQIIIINKGKLWLYDIDLQQLTIKKLDADAIALNPVAVLSGNLSDLLTHNTITESGNSITLYPKVANSSIRWIKIAFFNNKLRALEFSNQLQQLTQIDFNHVRINEPIEKDMFTIKPTKNTDIFKE